MPSPPGPVPSHPNWMPQPIATYWDDLLEGVKTPDDWAKKRAVIKQRFLQLLREDAKPEVPALPA